jgi:hypothetical protein
MKTEIAKILIYVPKDLTELTAAIPFFHVLHESYPDAQLQAIATKYSQKFLKSFSFKIETFVYDDKEMGLPGIHKYAVNNHEIFNIDLFLDLEGTLKSSFLGFSFKSKSRVGFEKGVNKFLLTHRVLPIDSYRPDRKYLGLLENFMECSFSGRKVIGLERVELENEKNADELEKSPPYFLIHANDLLEQKEFWNDFFRFFDDQYFVVWFDPELGEGKLEETSSFLKALESENKYELRTGTDEFFMKLLLHSEIFLTEDLIWTCFANYFGKNTYCLVSKATDIPFMEHFERTAVLIEWKDGVPSKWIAEDSSQPIGTVDKLVNIFYEIHEL